MKHTYLDHAATTPMFPEVWEAMKPYLTEHFGNPSSIHGPGQKAHLAINEVRAKFAEYLKCDITEVYFTSGATESISTALKGIAHANQSQGKHIVSSTFEHKATLEALKELEKEGFEVTYIQPKKSGVLEAKDVSDALREDTILVTLMLVNNELGTIQPIQEIGKILKEKEIVFHTDAVQAFTYMSCSTEKLGVDALSLSAHKFGGPKGVGLLYLSRNVACTPLIPGNQEFGVRGGTQNVAGIVGMGIAARRTAELRDEHIANMTSLRTYLRTRMDKFLSDFTIANAVADSIPGILNISFAGIFGETLLIRLDLEGIALSTGSACSSESRDPSHVLQTIGLTADQAQSSIRISMGHGTTEADIDYLIEKLAFHVGNMRMENITY